MTVFGIDPGSERTGFGCVTSDGRRHRLVRCGAITAGASAAFPDRLGVIYRALVHELDACRPDCVAIENLFYATNVRSALKLGHARGVAILAAVECGIPVSEYTPAEIKRAVVGYGRAEKPQVGQMVKLLLGLERVPAPHDVADALAVAICHVHSASGWAAGGTKVPPLRTRTVGGTDVPPLRTRAAGETDVPPLQPSPERRDFSPADTRARKTWRQYRPPTR